MAKKFDQQHVLITGAARGIGFEIAIQFAKEGAILSLVDFNELNLATAVTALEAIGNKVYPYLVDISNRTAVYQMVEQAEKIQPIDILINNAGIASEKPFLNIEEAEWNQILSINITGMFHVSQAVCKYMAVRKKGVVVNMASKNGLDGEFGYTHYNVSKGGVIMLTKTMALELAHLGIRVNAVCPGYIQTPMSMEIDPPEFTAQFVHQYIPLNRPGKVQEIAPIFLFLASEDSSFITGQVIIADGGQLAGQKPGIDLLNKISIG
ncbi:MAG: SDR family oxidoreductase [Sphingobacteriia bacterium]|nr:MAG: SDR family oxidoreductase [Sphingobacteriia bacterium]